MKHFVMCQNCGAGADAGDDAELAAIQAEKQCFVKKPAPTGRKDYWVCPACFDYEMPEGLDVGSHGQLVLWGLIDTLNDLANASSLQMIPDERLVKLGRQAIRDAFNFFRI